MGGSRFLTADDINWLIEERGRADYFEECVKADRGMPPKKICDFMRNEVGQVIRRANKEG